MVAGVLAGAAVLLVVAGAAKLLDPSRTAGALAALGWPSSPWVVRAGAAVELVLGAATLVVGGPGLSMLVAASYLGFALFVMTALRSGTPVGTCGCFARADTPPRPGHVVVNGLLALGAIWAAAAAAPPLLDAAWTAWIVAGLVGSLVLRALTVRVPMRPGSAPASDGGSSSGRAEAGLRGRDG